tara:strand:+ start:11312 stop:12871 length:1560 start_codon:yes stop_codon:yes gene_type:complete
MSLKRPRAPGSKSIFGLDLANLAGRSDPTLGHVDGKISNDRHQELHHAATTNPSLVAAISVLTNLVLSGGLVVRRDDVEVELKPAFRRFIEARWLPFSRDVLVSFLVLGGVVVVIDDDPESMNDVQSGRLSAPRQPLQIPMVPRVGEVEIVATRGGRTGLVRSFYALNHLGRVESRALVVEGSKVFFMNTPDAAYNVVSPVAAVLDDVQFVAVQKKCASVASLSTCKPLVLSQSERSNTHAGLDPQSLFFDSESRAVQQSDDISEDTGRVHALNMVNMLIQQLNKAQSSNAQSGFVESAVQGGSAYETNARKGLAMAGDDLPDVGTKTFALPSKHVGASNCLQQASARGDLAALDERVTRAVASGLGLPFSLLSESRFASSSTNDLLMLNHTVANLSRHLCHVLTATYRGLYADDGEDVEMCLGENGVTSTVDIVSAFKDGLVDEQFATPLVARALGADKAVAEELTARMVQERERKKKLEDDEMDVKVEASKRQMLPVDKAVAATEGGERGEGAAEAQ